MNAVVLVPTTVALLDLEERGTEPLCAALGVATPPEWPPDASDTGRLGWLRRLADRWPGEQAFASYYVIAAGELVGNCGFKGPPDNAGSVEIGYSVIAPRRRRGYASGAVALLVERAFADPRVSAVTAETLPDGLASQGVLRRSGFREIGTRVDDEDGEVVCFERRRPD